MSYKTTQTASKKRTLDEVVTKYETSDLYRQHPARCMVILDTLKIVANKLPFSSVETPQSTLLRKLCYKEAAQAPLNRKIVQHSIVELYACGKSEVIGLINSARSNRGAFFTVVTDFWTSEVQNKKYLGVRLYMFDAGFRFRSVLLATRQFNPPFGDRDRSCKGCRRDEIDPCPHSKHKSRNPFRKWILNILRDFGIRSADLFGSTTDGGSDVKWMMSQGFSLRWEWCISHLSHAATKAAFGLVDDINKSKNKAVTRLLKKITTTVFQPKHVDVMDTLFCGTLRSAFGGRDHPTTELPLTSICRFGASGRAHTAEVGRTEKLLAGHKRDLIQLLSLLQPIANNNAMAQVESPVQVDVLLSLFKLRLQTLNSTVPLRDYRSLEPLSEPIYFPMMELTQLVKQTRQLLCDAFHVRYFRRYTERKEMARCSFIFEMQLALHPDFKDLEGSLKRVVLLSNQQYGEDEDNHVRNYDAVVNIINNKLVNEMVVFATTAPAEAPPAQQYEFPADENLTLFRRTQVPRPAPAHHDTAQQARAELVLWQTAATELRRDERGKPLELVTDYWARQVGQYALLPLVARALYAVPSTSGQTERDFGNSGRQITPQRSRTGGVNVDMSAFVNCNRDFIDPTQCAVIPRKDREDHMPSNVHVTTLTDDDEEGDGDNDDDSDDDVDFARLAPQVYSNTSLYDDDYDEDIYDERGDYLDDYE